MSKSYNEIMDKISVTEEMRERILDKIQESDIVEYKKHKTAKRIRKVSFFASAAVIAITVGTLFISHFHNRANMEEPPQEPGEITQIYNGIEECVSLKELEQKVGFEIEDIEKLLPFTPTQVDYLSYWAEMAEIQYTDTKQTVTFRKSVGEEDNSGDYNEYDFETETVVDRSKILLKGTADGIRLAIWNKDSFAYSLSFESAVSQEEILSIIQNIK